MDYEALEGKEVLVIEDREGDYIEFRGVVAGCDPDIGITIDPLNEEEKEKIKRVYGHDAEHFYCLNGPSSPHYSKKYGDDTFQKNFDFAIKRIQKGVFSQQEEDNFFMKLNNLSIYDIMFINQVECAFE